MVSGCQFMKGLTITASKTSHPFEIPSCAKDFALSRDDHSLDALIHGELRESFCQVLDHLQIECIVGLGAVKRHHRSASHLLQIYCFFHSRISLLIS